MPTPGTTHVQVRIDTTRLRAAVDRIAAAFDGLGAAARRAVVLGGPLVRHARARRVMAQPRPLCIDGHAYHRRTRSRRGNR